MFCNRLPGRNDTNKACSKEKLRLRSMNDRYEELVQVVGSSTQELSQRKRGMRDRRCSKNRGFVPGADGIRSALSYKGQLFCVAGGPSNVE